MRALQQGDDVPAGADLRFITTAMKIVTDLGRIGDQAVNIARQVLELDRELQTDTVHRPLPDG